MAHKFVQNATWLEKRRSMLPSQWWSLLLQDLSQGKNVCVCGFWSFTGRAVSCKALLWPFSNWERLENSLAVTSTSLSCLTDGARWTVSLRSPCVLPANFFSVLNDFYSTFWAAPVNLILSSCDLTQFPGEWSVKVQLSSSVLQTLRLMVLERGAHGSTAACAWFLSGSVTGEVHVLAEVSSW